MLALVAAAEIEDLEDAAGALAVPGCGMEKDEFFAMVRALPDLRTGEVFRQVEEILDRIYRSFQATNRADAYQVSGADGIPARAAMC